MMDKIGRVVEEDFYQAVVFAGVTSEGKLVYNVDLSPR